MTEHATTRAAAFRRLHETAGKPLVLPNAWDAGSARMIEACGAAAIATTSAGLAWSCGYPDGNAVPPRVLAAAVAQIARVLAVPLTVDAEGGYSADPRAVGDAVAAVVDAGAVGVNLEDGNGPPEDLCAKIAAAKAAAARLGVDLFVNARTDVFLRGLVPPERAVAETIARARRYGEAGCDGIFVPLLADPDAIRAVAAAIALPLNVMVVPHLPPVAELAALGVRRVSAGSAIAQAAYGCARRAAQRLLGDGRYDAMFETTINYGETNALFAPRP
jgi:2-methylisocitrate lyase-like PEP mutase family enzyme